MEKSILLKCPFNSRSQLHTAEVLRISALAVAA
jgi:hypothetical protein